MSDDASSDDGGDDEDDDWEATLGVLSIETTACNACVAVAVEPAA